MGITLYTRQSSHFPMKNHWSLANYNKSIAHVRNLTDKRKSCCITIFSFFLPSLIIRNDLKCSSYHFGKKESSCELLPRNMKRQTHRITTCDWRHVMCLMIRLSGSFNSCVALVFDWCLTRGSTIGQISSLFLLQYKEV
jgi:hypothetical protein